ncbi:MAG: hypothetical protein QXP36_02960 [Conexivisphaerales archaeon]
MNPKEIIGRANFYTRLGYSNYIAWWLAPLAYISVIYALILKAFLPPGVFAYALTFFAFMFASFLLGYAMKKWNIYSIDHAINRETDPYNDKPIGKKEILNYENAIKAYDREINNYEITKAICQKLGLEDQLALIEANIKSAQEYKAKMQEMLSKAKVIK